MIDIKDYIGEPGQVDFVSYHAAQEENGERCWQCKGIIIPEKGFRTLCVDCQALTLANDEVSHSLMIRCPACVSLFEAFGQPFYEILEEGDHTICCEYCGHDFKVNTHISYSFTSPELIKSEDNEP